MKRIGTYSRMFNGIEHFLDLFLASRRIGKKRRAKTDEIKEEGEKMREERKKEGEKKHLGEIEENLPNRTVGTGEGELQF